MAGGGNGSGKGRRPWAGGLEGTDGGRSRWQAAAGGDRRRVSLRRPAAVPAIGAQHALGRAELALGCGRGSRSDAGARARTAAESTVPETVPFRQTLLVGATFHRIPSGGYRRIADDEAEMAVTTRTGAEDGSDQETDPNLALIPI